MSQPHPATHLFSASKDVPWVKVGHSRSYFITDDGQPWTPIGHNEAITWPNMVGCFRRQDIAHVETYMSLLASRGVTCLRMMLEYCESCETYFEQPVGHFRQDTVDFWDQMFRLCAHFGLRLLLTPFDTFWMLWQRWYDHPYNKINGGPCLSPSSVLVDPETRMAIKSRLAFAVERWGHTGTIFAWDLWNEISLHHAEGLPEQLMDFVSDISTFLRRTELLHYGRSHLQTVSAFEPHLRFGVPAGSIVADCIWRHPTLNFATTHFYDQQTIDNPQNTVDAAITTGEMVREALHEIRDGRPFLDSENGPIHLFKDHQITLQEDFDNEYFRHMQWSHFASGGCGGGMRWPNRHPHTLTDGMHQAQYGLSKFLPLIKWHDFDRINLNHEIALSTPNFKGFACGDDKQAIIWLLRINQFASNGMLRRDLEPELLHLFAPNLSQGKYKVTTWDTVTGSIANQFYVKNYCEVGLTIVLPSVLADLAIAIQHL